MHTVRSVLFSMLIGFGLVGCQNPASPEAQMTAAFNRWNEMALLRDPGAARLLCKGVANPDPAYFGMIDQTNRGYSGASQVTVSVTGNTGEVDFNNELDDDYEMVYVHMVKQGGKWKVCYEQTTGPGGFG
jgi:hypothetical protein